MKAGKLGAKVVRYADDFVVMCGGSADKALAEVRRILGRLELHLNEEKTSVLDMREDRLDFLGFSIRQRRSRRTGKKFPMVTPSEKAVKHIRREIKEQTCRKTLARGEDVVINMVNRVVRGWVEYFYYGHCSKTMASLKWYTEERVRTYLRRKHRKRGRGYEAYPNKYLYQGIGLYGIPTTAPWKQLAKATG